MNCCFVTISDVTERFMRSHTTFSLAMLTCPYIDFRRGVSESAAEQDLTLGEDLGDGLLDHGLDREPELDDLGGLRQFMDVGFGKDLDAPVAAEIVGEPEDAPVDPGVLVERVAALGNVHGDRVIVVVPGNDVQVLVLVAVRTDQS